MPERRRAQRAGFAKRVGAVIEILSPEDIEELLEKNFVGRVGVHSDGRTYVVPISYAYAHGCVYGHSAEGLKTRMMRKNPTVCFETDSVQDPFNWRSVIAWGTCEELHGEASEEAMRSLLMRFLPAKVQAAAERTLVLGRPGLADRRAVVYRIRLIEKTGRFEATER